MKIGLIDYMIDEWHANNYPAWIELACEKLGVAAEIAYVWAEEPAPEGKTLLLWMNLQVVLIL